MKALKEQALEQVWGGFKKDDAVVGGIELAGLYYQQNPGLSPTMDDILKTVHYFYEALKEEY